MVLDLVVAEDKWKLLVSLRKIKIQDLELMNQLEASPNYFLALRAKGKLMIDKRGTFQAQGHVNLFEYFRLN